MDTKNFTLVKTWENRIKAVSPVLKDEPDRAYIFQILLNKRPEISELQISVKSGEIDIRYDAEKMPRAALLKAMDAMLANVAKKPVAAVKKQLPGTPEEIELLVEGMSCPACALLIEMSLKKEEQIVDASADLETKRVKVYGTQSKRQVIEKIEKLGYKHIVESK
ncbi:cation transporter [Methylomarinum sp. Ch1-1]|uniref:Cation transporter n=1 Tax=Methylomarinum roseum TaxID=3067653 RepID=A0AAU7NSV1_9GAMM|nr:cation transporter [Methylomarinum sp. Ch1-1]MDP4519987.1 cation transporter [Methylomarinum sp. Ch1-1]